MTSIERFNAHPEVLRQAPLLFRRGGHLRALRDMRMLLALNAYGSRELGHSVAFERGAFGEPVMSFELRRSHVLELLGMERTRSPRDSVPSDFASAAWRNLRDSLEALTTTEVTVALRVKRRTGKIEPTEFVGELVEIDERLVRVHCCAASGYFVSVPTASLRLPLTETQLRLACWLLARHRGRLEHGRLRHNWTFSVTSAELKMAGFAGSPARMRSAIDEAFRRLLGFDVLSAYETEATGWSVQLSPTFFHQEAL